MLPSAPYLLTRPNNSVIDISTTAWANAVVAAGGAVSATQYARVNTLIKGLKSDGNWNVFDRLWLWGGEVDAKQATIDVKNLTVGTVVPGLTLSASGYTGDHTSGYFNTNTNLGTLGGNFSQNSGAVGVYIVNSRTTNQGWRACGCSSGHLTNDFTTIVPLWSDGNIYTSVNDASGGTTLGSNAQGQWIVSRTAASGAGALTLRRNGAPLLSATGASTGLAVVNFAFFAIADASSSVSDFSGDTIGVGFITGGLTITQSDQIASRINAYMTAWGINVY